MISRHMTGWPGGIAVAALLVLAGCGGSSGPAGPSSSSQTTAGFDFGSNNPRKVTAFGDSITFGVLEEKKRIIIGKLDTKNTYPADLQVLLGPTWTVVNRGQGGERVENGASRIGGVLATDRPGFILIMEGTNNASRCDDSNFVVSNLQTMVDLAKANKTIPILGTIPPDFRHDDCAHDVIDTSNILIRGLASAEGIVLAEIFDGMNDRSLFGQSLDRDPLHPNDQGYQVMAGIWFNALKRAVPGGLTTTALRPKNPKKK